LAKKEGLKEKVAVGPGTQKKKTSSGRKLLETFLGFILSLLIISFLDYGLSHGIYSANVHIYGIDYHYYDPETGANWTYFMPGNYSMSTDSVVNGTYPFTSDLNCSMTFTKFYSLTPGFVYQVQNLPITFHPEVPTNLNITMIAPSHPFSGPLNVKIYVYYNC